MLTIYVAINLSYVQLVKGIGNYATRENNNATRTHTNTWGVLKQMNITSFSVLEQFTPTVMEWSIGELMRKHIIPVNSSLVKSVWSSNVVRLLKEYGRPSLESVFDKIYMENIR